MAPSKLEDLCSICSKIDLHSYFKSAVHCAVDRRGYVAPTSDAIRLGTVEEVIGKRDTCSFCRLVINAVCSRRLWSLTSPERLLANARKGGRSQELWMYSFCYLETKMSPLNVYRIGIASEMPTTSMYRPQIHQMGEIQLCAEKPIGRSLSTLGLGRMLRDTINIGLIDHWLYVCEDEHGSHCDQQKLSYTTPPKDLLCVDVQEGCIRPLPEGANYCTLSYCWLEQRVLTLVKANFQEFSTEGSLFRRQAELPKVISDTINMVRRLGQRFVWIDSLCIIQDDNDHKRHQIGQMDKVYGSSFLGFIAAKCLANDSLDNTGLARWNPEARTRTQYAAEIKGLTLTIPFESIHSLIQESRYDRRQWTYQEWILPRRLLFFTDSQVYFQCPSALFCEDSIGEGLPIGTTITPVSNLWNPFSSWSDQQTFQMGPPTLPSKPYKEDHPEAEAFTTAVDDYATHMETFSGRELTYEEDILNAFRGLQHIFERLMDTRFWCGLPERYFDHTILWLPRYKTQRRMRRDASQGYAFPSWSWAGWMRSAGLMFLWMPYVPKLHTEITWYIFTDKNEALRMKSEECPCHLFTPFPSCDLAAARVQSDLAVERAQWIIRDPIETDYDHDTEFEITRLGCWTQTSAFRVKNEKLKWHTRELAFRSADNLKITDDQGNWVGCMIIDRDWASAHAIDTQPQFRFILLSRSEAHEMTAPDSDEPMAVPMFDEILFPHRNWCYLNVMLVEKAGDYWHRVSVGIIHEDAWNVSNPSSELIVLE